MSLSEDVRLSFLEFEPFYYCEYDEEEDDELDDKLDEEDDDDKDDEAFELDFLN